MFPTQQEIIDAVARMHEDTGGRGYPCESDLWDDDEPWEYLGSGHFSTALLHTPSNVVLKVSMRPTDVAPRWWEYCLNTSGPNLPKIYSVGRVLNYEVCTMEYLPLTVRDARWMGADNLHGPVPGHEWGQQMQPADADTRNKSDEYLPALVNTAQLLGRLDIHDENVMLRGACFDPYNPVNWVLTDPVSFTE